MRIGSRHIGPSDILFHTVSLPICVVTFDLEILTVTAGRSLAAAFCLAVATWFAGMSDTMSSARFGGSVSGLEGALEAWDSDFGGPGRGVICRHCADPRRGRDFELGWLRRHRGRGGGGVGRARGGASAGRASASGSGVRG